MDLKKYPFEKLECEIKLLSWTYDGSLVISKYIVIMYICSNLLPSSEHKFVINGWQITMYTFTYLKI